MNSSDAYSSRSDVFDMKMAAGLARLKAEAMPSGDFGLAPLSAWISTLDSNELIFIIRIRRNSEKGRHYWSGKEVFHSLDAG